MKAILLSIKPEWLVKILNGEKTIEVRKVFPKDYVGWVYLYCSKGKPRVIIQSNGVIAIDNKHYSYGDEELNGKVIARFWCDKIEEIVCQNAFNEPTYNTELLSERDLCIKSCLGLFGLFDYLGYKNGYAIHISKLEIFDKPKELSEFHTVNKIGIPQYQFGKGTCDYKKITKAPQNYCYILEENK